MATTYIKNQIIKQLSKFAKNVSPDQISVEVLRGKGELKNIEIDENILCEILELPPWVQIDSAVCTRVAVNIPWTRLKTAPMQLLIDEICVKVSLTTNTKPKSTPKADPKKQKSDKNIVADQGFVTRLIENMSVYVNTVDVNFKSSLFTGSVMLSRLSLESRAPNWQVPNDVRMSRLRHPTINDLIIFKQLSWQLLRVEASPCCNGEEFSAPLRLITSDGKCRIAIKKHGVDASLIAGRVQLILDDILWVATLVQVRTAIRFYRHLMDLIKSTSNNNLKATKAKNSIAQKMAPTNMTLSKHKVVKKTAINLKAEQNFNSVDIKETSLHSYVGKVELHFTDDSASDKSTVFPPNWDIKGGSLQVTMHKLGVDLYPYHLAGSSRSHWVRYRSPSSNAKQWIDELLQFYGFDNKKEFLFAQIVVVRINDLVVYAVNEETSKRADAELKILCADKQCRATPNFDNPMVHAELCEFYSAYDGSETENRRFLPPAAHHFDIAPILGRLHTRTFRWLHYIYQDVFKLLDLDSMNSDALPHADVILTATMPRFIIERPPGMQIFEHDEGSNEDDQLTPLTLEAQIATLVITNCPAISHLPTTLSDTNDMVSFLALLHKLLHKDLITSNECAFWSERIADCNKKEAKLAQNDFWAIHILPVWADFTGAENFYAQSTAPFLFDSSFSIFASLYKSLPSAKLNLLSNVRSSVKVILNHYQFLFMMRVIENVIKCLDFIEADAKHFEDTIIKNNKPPLTICNLTVANEVSLHFVVPTTGSFSCYEVRSIIARQGRLTVENLADDNDTPQTKHGCLHICNDDTNRLLENELARASSPIVARTASTSSISSALKRDGDKLSMVAKQNLLSGANEFLHIENLAFLHNTNSQLSLFDSEVRSIDTDMSDDDFINLDLDASASCPFDDVFDKGPAPVPSVEDAEEANELNTMNEGSQLRLVDKVKQRILNEKHTFLSLKLQDCHFKMFLTSGIGNKMSIVCHQGEVNEAIAMPLSDYLDTLCQHHREFKAIDYGLAGINTNGNLRIEIDAPTSGTTSVKPIIENFNIELKKDSVANIAAFIDDKNAEKSNMSIDLRLRYCTLLIEDHHRPNAQPTFLQINDLTVLLTGLEQVREYMKSIANERVSLQTENDELKQKLIEAKGIIRKLIKAQMQNEQRDKEKVNENSRTTAIN